MFERGEGAELPLTPAVIRVVVRLQWAVWETRGEAREDAGRLRHSQAAELAGSEPVDTNFDLLRRSRSLYQGRVRERLRILSSVRFGLGCRNCKMM